MQFVFNTLNLNRIVHNVCLNFPLTFTSKYLLYTCIICESLTDKQKIQIGGFDIASALVDLHLWWFLLSYMKASD